jgi:hypothetical protein
VARLLLIGLAGMSFHDLHDLATAAVQADLSLLLDGLEAGSIGLLIVVLALLRAARTTS